MKKHRKEQDAFPGESPAGRALEARLEETLRRRKSLKRQAAGVLLFLLLLTVFTRVLFGLARVEGNSMYPEYRDGDLIVYSRLTGSPERGDVVLVRIQEGRILIKRVIGLPGEEVYIDERTGGVFINGTELEEEYGPTKREGDLSYPVTLGEGEYFVLGDNREDSLDSRYYGPVEKGQITGKVEMTFRVEGKEEKEQQKE